MVRHLRRFAVGFLDGGGGGALLWWEGFLDRQEERGAIGGPERASSRGAWGRRGARRADGFGVETGRRGPQDQRRRAREAAAGGGGGSGGGEGETALGVAAGEVVVVPIVRMSAAGYLVAEGAREEGRVHFALEGLGRAEDDEGEEAGGDAREVACDGGHGAFFGEVGIGLVDALDDVAFGFEPWGDVGPFEDTFFLLRDRLALRT